MYKVRRRFRSQPETDTSYSVMFCSNIVSGKLFGSIIHVRRCASNWMNLVPEKIERGGNFYRIAIRFLPKRSYFPCGNFHSVNPEI
ncbi:hypothetical protein SAMN05443144_102161 [Fodinibius roseus]|uniref:Uncharacterized protein n=1 Tax=Fodinibius roseus TaxID=1194090 RepID=A0A1M4UZK3_9BACT|nr:hypothetical protein SAMN05443144_102161 [Fodinibius roseus]